MIYYGLRTGGCTMVDFEINKQEVKNYYDNLDIDRILNNIGLMVDSLSDEEVMNIFYEDWSKTK